MCNKNKFSVYNLKSIHKIKYLRFLSLITSTKLLKYSLLINFFLLNTISITSQRINLQFKHLQVKDGLSHSTVHSIFQDKNGFMWFGTDIGLNKYDGHKFTIYQNNSNDNKSVSSNYIVEIFEDSYGLFWIGNGYTGLDCFDRENEIFIHYINDPKNANSISNNNIRAIFEDKNKNLWIGTSGGGLNLYNRKTNSFSNLLKDSLNANSIGSNYISSISQDSSGNLWIGSTEGILIKYNQAKKKFTNFKLYGEFKSNLYNTSFGKTYVDSNNNIWFGTEIGLFMFDQHKEKISHFKPNNNNTSLNVAAVSSILEYEKDIYFIATDHGGLNIFNKKTGKFSYLLNKRYDQTSISNNQLYDLYRSPDGIIWIGSFHGGVNILDKNAIKFQQYKYIIDDTKVFNCCNSVLTLAEDKDKNIWVGNDGQGIEIYNPQTRSIKHLMPETGNSNSISGNCITEIYKDQQDNLWIGYYMEGMSVLNWRTKNFTHFRYDPKNRNGIGGNNIWTIIQDHEGNIWIGTIGNGIDLYNPKSNIFRHFVNSPSDNNSLSNNDVYKILQDRNKNIWIGTRNGLNLLEKGQSKFKRFLSTKTNSNGIFGDCIFDIFQDRKGNIWVGTEQALNLYQPTTGTFVQFKEKDGIHGNAVLAILEDEQNNLWFSTNKGLTKFNYENHKFENYDVADGLQGDEFNYTSSLIDYLGKMYFGGKNGFNLFSPKSILKNQKVPPIYITGFKILNVAVTPGSKNKAIEKSINFAEKINLSYKQNVISIEYAALCYTNPQKNQYAYMMENFDKDWIFADNRNEATYTNLNPGQYVFHVKGSNSDGIWNETGTSLEIYISPPWWKTKIAYGSLILAIISLLLGFYYFRINQLKNQKELLEKLVKERTNELKHKNEILYLQADQLNETNTIIEERQQHIEEQAEELSMSNERLKMSNAAKNMFFSIIAHDLKNPFNAILGFCQMLFSEYDNIDDIKKKKLIGIVYDSSKNLYILLENLLQWATSQTGKIKFEPKEIILNELIASNISLVKDLISEKNLELNHNLKSEIKIYADSNMINTVIRNLIVNAIKYTEIGGISIEAFQDTDKTTVKIIDTGIGINSEKLKNIFGIMVSKSTHGTKGESGTGLGLILCKEFVEKNGGSISVTSEPSKGSTFCFTLPRKS